MRVIQMYADGMFDNLAKFSYALFKCACVVYIHNHCDLFFYGHFDVAALE